jgi:hypothetical protein
LGPAAPAAERGKPLAFRGRPPKYHAPFRPPTEGAPGRRRRIGRRNDRSAATADRRPRRLRGDGGGAGRWTHRPAGRGVVMGDRYCISTGSASGLWLRADARSRHASVRAELVSGLISLWRIAHKFRGRESYEAGNHDDDAKNKQRPVRPGAAEFDMPPAFVGLRVASHCGRMGVSLWSAACHFSEGWPAFQLFIAEEFSRNLCCCSSHRARMGAHWLWTDYFKPSQEGDA